MRFKFVNQHRIRLRHLQSFADIAESGSMTASAKTLNTSQPALSRTISELEDTLKCRLFHRDSTGLSLTPSGRQLQAHVLAAFEHLETGLAGIGEDFQNQYVRCAALPSVSRGIFPKAVVRFKEEYPEVSIEIQDPGNPTFLDAIRRGELDFSVGRVSPPTRMEGLSFNHLYSEELMFVAHHTHPLANKKDLAIDELANHPMLLPHDGVVIREELDRFLIAHDQPLARNRIETMSFEFIRAILGQSDAVAFCPAGAIFREIKNGQISQLNVPGPSMMGAIGITTSALRRLSPPAKRLIQMIKEEAGVTD
ncbi:LysR substrate-binding domain-containing protein [Cochlodiniinecator piscidefendens]|uniref:LysR substrate-binding domain-containing protein n=1 Tax=Cochlodiniinecator piscidefendens TaxID=2715756 RepID=UPI001408B709|nr:LysR substrate-binding domain-containing protein [Cochlodiniinecator piscidefendens]